MIRIEMTLEWPESGSNDYFGPIWTDGGLLNIFDA